MASRIFRIYIAGPLFTLPEREHNKRLYQALAERMPNVEFIVPQLRAAMFLPDLQAVALDCFEQVKVCDLVLANLDGPDSDSGTCAEVGYAAALGKRIIGYRTDFRGSEVDGVNAMLRYACTKYLQVPSCTSSFDELLLNIMNAFGELFPR